MTTRTYVDDYAWLVGEQGRAWLEHVEAEPRPVHRWVAELRKSLSSNRTHLVIQQVDLRNRAAAKFRQPGQMFFTPQGLEQASDEWVAAYKSTRFPSEGVRADLCCGIGGDLRGLASRGEVVGVDANPIQALLAQANVEQLASGGASVLTCDAREVDAANYSACHVDPQRRQSHERHAQLRYYSPGEPFLNGLREASPALAIKLAPAAQVPSAWQQAAEFEWISSRRECRQLVAWFGKLATEPGKRRATRLIADGASPAVKAFSFSDIPAAASSIATRIGRYLFEPDPAVIAGQLVGALANRVGIDALSASIPYLTSDRAHAHPLLSCFKITAQMPFQEKKLADELARLRIGSLEIKKRGVDVDPSRLRKRLKLSGEQSATLIVTRWQGRHIALLADRMSSEGGWT